MWYAITKIAQFHDLMMTTGMPKMCERDYETCPSCQKHRLLESDISGQRTCKKCRDKPQKSCKACHCMIAAGCADYAMIVIGIKIYGINLIKIRKYLSLIIKTAV